MDPADLLTRLKVAGVRHELIAGAIGRSRPVAVQIMAGRRPLKAHEIAPLVALLGDHDTVSNSGQYVPVEVLPAYAGMGGMGFAGDERDTALVPRALVEDQLHGRPADFLLVYTRGDSMEPDFFQGDQLLIDCRDRSPTQPGPFALRIGDGYAVKNVELSREGMRVFSSNSKYANEWLSPEEVEIIGRPVWVGRML